jgi:hypothetical protein
MVPDLQFRPSLRDGHFVMLAKQKRCRAHGHDHRFAEDQKWRS